MFLERYGLKTDKKIPDKTLCVYCRVFFMVGYDFAVMLLFIFP